MRGHDMLPYALGWPHDGRSNGTISSSSQVTVHATAENRAKSEAKILNVSIVGLSGAVAIAEVANTANVVASVGSGASIGSSGEVNVSADLKGVNLQNEAIAIANGISTWLVAAGPFMAWAIVGGQCGGG
jgi:hypothetical protein